MVEIYTPHHVQIFQLAVRVVIAVEEDDAVPVFPGLRLHRFGHICKKAVGDIRGGGGFLMVEIYKKTAAFSSAMPIETRRIMCSSFSA